MTREIPFDDLQNKARNTTCKDCGASAAVEADPEIGGIRCTKCGWRESLLDESD